MKKNKGLQISFAWLFSIIAGAFILFLAIFVSIKVINTEQTIQDAKIGKEIGILLNPLEIGFESGKTTSLTLPTDTRIYNKCNNKGNFGKQIIQISQKNFKKWTSTNIDVGFSNKYIFSRNYVEGKKFYIFSKPFEFPFKVADIIYITSSLKKYCFINAPEDIQEELKDLKQQNIFLKNCSEGSIKICFMEQNNCEINVDYDLEYVDKGNEKVYFSGDSLMYAAIFSEKEIYECQLKRLMQRVEQLTLLYKDKANFISRIGCESNINQDLIQLNNLAKSFSSSTELAKIVDITKKIKDRNDFAQCKIW
jgi:hypothetical protein